MSGWLMQAPYGIYPAADGHIALSRVTLAGLAEVLECPELAQIGEHELFSRKGEISRLVAKHTIRFSVAELEARLTSHDFWFAAVNNYGQMARDRAACSNGSMKGHSWRKRSFRRKRLCKGIGAIR